MATRKTWPCGSKRGADGSRRASGKKRGRVYLRAEHMESPPAELSLGASVRQCGNKLHIFRKWERREDFVN